MTTVLHYVPKDRFGRVGISLKRKVAERYGTLCHWCGVQTIICKNKNGTPLPDDYRTLEHIIRRADGGSNAIENCRIACRKCNNERHDYPKTKSAPKTTKQPGIRPPPVSAAVGELFLAIR